MTRWFWATCLLLNTACNTSIHATIAIGPLADFVRTPTEQRAESLDLTGDNIVDKLKVFVDEPLPTAAGDKTGEIDYDTDLDEVEEPTYAHGESKNSAGRDNKSGCKIYNYSRYQNAANKKRRLRRASYSAANNQVVENEIIVKCSSKRSAEDAAERFLQLEEKNHTTVQCVDLKTKHGFVKRFCFTNNANSTRKLLDKATELKYDLIIAQGGHAEVQFIQFLCDRARKHQRYGAYYTDVISMGCSRKHCARCDIMLQLFLRQDYHLITAAATDYQRTSASSRRPSSGTVAVTANYGYAILEG
ncbi:MAG: hypothetical protein AAFV97_03600 [Bacteroidota bacterium]